MDVNLCWWNDGALVSLFLSLSGAAASILFVSNSPFLRLTAARP